HQVKARARTVVDTAAVPPGDDAELAVAQRAELRWTVHDMIGQAGHLFLQRRMTTAAALVRTWRLGGHRRSCAGRKEKGRECGVSWPECRRRHGASHRTKRTECRGRAHATA